ncbi:HNH endonuclease [Bradyrhizobium diazoefficiens]|uniref:Endonuclease n=1 Tax=Bradyrhizobium diazoefficiens TaxID=1355477 RepID=A0A810CWR7_9BRAD|nr:HNH endonuclease [Bradyrhizobium diazoefficiens]WLA70007.1 HNH endonuclease [Bradyrhizobium diazoefficiens]BCE22394.1 endonuclease [Bradyrhizobium diazoefficiens]BCE48658.1 endonuclease [Bradyrhizobium diazoefficiens]BCE92174.1 endonuclease [Bradyrhizobium diazoefficiens]BCF27101.1 endonuclease [Bradyrhizobium diazoefficiens]
MKERPSIERLREVLAYAPETGRLTWKVALSPRVIVGADAGGNCGRGYIRVCVDGARMPAHHVIWAMETGPWPAEEVDHEDLNKGNNRWGNLREATRSQNEANKPPSKSNLTGLKGVIPLGNRFQAQVQFKGQRFQYGSYGTPEEAHAAYQAKARELFGEFIRVIWSATHPSRTPSGIRDAIRNA